MPHNKFEKVMAEFRKGKLRSGSKKGPKVTNPEQAIAISYSEERKAKKKNNPKKKNPKSKTTVVVAKGVKIPKKKEAKLKKKPGSSNTGKYKNVSPKEFAGSSGGSSAYSFPINTLARARNALARAHFAPNPAGIRKKVYSKYPQLKKRKLERDK